MYNELNCCICKTSFFDGNFGVFLKMLYKTNGKLASYIHTVLFYTVLGSPGCKEVQAYRSSQFFPSRFCCNRRGVYWKVIFVMACLP
jgi:hypothetical protein